MRRFVFCYVAFLFIATQLFSQTPEEDTFDQAFLHIYMQTANDDVARALELADSLYQTATTDIHQVRSLMLIGDMHHRMANRDSTIHYALLANKIANKAGLYDWQARSYGVLSTQYREIGLFSEGKKYLQLGLEAIEKVEDKARVTLYKGQSNQELGYFAIEEDGYSDAIRYFKQASALFEELPESLSRNFALLQNEERLGLCYLELGDIDSAKAHYQHALETILRTTEEDMPIKGFIYNGLGRIYLLEQAYREADSCLTVAHRIAEHSGFPHLQISVYKSLSQYHQTLGDQEQHQHYATLYSEAIRLNAVKHKKYADNIITGLQQQVAEMSTSYWLLGLTAGVLVVVFGIGAGIYIRKQKRNNLYSQKIIKRLQQNQSIVKEEMPTEKVVKDKNVMPESTKQDLLKKLERFESSQQFTDKNISIAVLAGKLKTNTKYLSYIINHYRNKDFNTYINELRINYIINKINEDNRYLNYKISYLAQECGFATHSQFTTVFRNLTGLSPSTFMACLKKERKKSDAAVVN